MRLPFLRSKETSKEPPRTADDVQVARVRAKRRFVGSVILLLAGVIVLPMLFEGQPRPLPVDLPIVIPGKDQGPPLASAEIRESAQEAGVSPAASAAGDAPQPGHGRDAGAQAKPDSKPQSQPDAKSKAPDAKADPKAEPKPEPKSEPKPEPKVELRAEPKPAAASVAARKPEADDRHKEPKAGSDSARALALLEGRDPGKAAKDALPETGRFVVQVGAYGEASSANDVRSKVEKLGLKTYTQEVQSGDGRRIRVRVGPFGSRDEADKAAAKLRAAGMPPSILSL